MSAQSTTAPNPGDATCTLCRRHHGRFNLCAGCPHARVRLALHVCPPALAAATVAGQIALPVLLPIGAAGRAFAGHVADCDACVLDERGDLAVACADGEGLARAMEASA